MKSLFQVSEVTEVKTRLAELRPESPRQWGKMNAPQAVAHCASSLEMALGDVRSSRLVMGRIVGQLIKPFVFREGEPFRRNTPTMKNLVILDQRDLNKERERLCGLIDRFATAGPAGCTQNPHAFFGRLTPDEWAVLMYKHLDHHLRQFGV